MLGKGLNIAREYIQKIDIKDDWIMENICYLCKIKCK